MSGKRGPGGRRGEEFAYNAVAWNSGRAQAEPFAEPEYQGESKNKGVQL